MSYRLNPKSTRDRLRFYAVHVIAALLALFGSAGEALAAPWRELKKRIEDERAEAEAARDRTVLARAVVHVRDATWDGVVGKLSSMAWMLSDKKMIPPYSSLFEAMNATVAKTLGVHKAAAFGVLLLKKLAELAHPELEPSRKQLEEANPALETAGKARDAAAQDELVLDIKRVKLIADIERQIALTEAAILQLHPGRSDFVRAVLSDEEDRPAKREEPETPENPEPAPPVA